MPAPGEDAAAPNRRSVAAATSALKAPSRNVFKPYRYMENRGTVKSYKAVDGRRAARCYMAESFAGKGAFTLSPMGQ